MNFIRKSSFDEYADWFFQRAVRNKVWDVVPETAEKRLEAFQSPKARGKFHEWMPSATWSIQELESVDELNSIMVVSAKFTREYKLWNNGEQRLLGIEANNAIKYDYFLTDPTSCRHCRYYFLHQNRKLQMKDADRLVLLSMEEDWKREAPDANYYLHDGFGRALPYAMLLAEKKLVFSPVEVFLAER